MDEAKDNVDYSATQRNQKEAKRGSQQRQQFGNEPQKKIRQKKSSETALEPSNPQIHRQNQKTAQQPMEVTKQQNDGGIYPTTRSEEDRQNNGQRVQQVGGAGDARKDQPELLGANKKHPGGKDRQQEATDLANHAAEKHARYYDGTLNSLCGTFPVQKSVSTFNRLKGSTESTEQTLNRWIQGLHTIDFGISFLIWRTFFYAKDLGANIYSKAGAKGNDAYAAISSLPMPVTIFLAVALVIFSPVIVGSLFFIVPALLLMLAVLIIPALFILPVVVFFILIFDMLPFPNKKAGSLTKNSFGRIPIFNRGPKTEGKEGEELRTTMAYQKTH